MGKSKSFAMALALISILSWFMAGTSVSAHLHSPLKAKKVHTLKAQSSQESQVADTSKDEEAEENEEIEAIVALCESSFEIGFTKRSFIGFQFSNWKSNRFLSRYINLPPPVFLV